MAISQAQPLLLLLISLFFLPALHAIPFTYCEDSLYPLKVNAVEISPNPIVMGEVATIKISGYNTGKTITHGRVETMVQNYDSMDDYRYYVRNLCDEIACPIAPGSFVLSYSLKIPDMRICEIGIFIKGEDSVPLTCIGLDLCQNRISSL